MICNAAVPVFIFISKGMVFAVAVRWPPGKIEHRKGDVGSLDGSRPVFYISPGILEGALRAPWDYRRITVRLPLTIARCPSDFSLIMAVKIVRKPSGYPPVPLRCTYGTYTAYYGLSTACLQSYGLMKTPGKLGAACSAHRRPHD